MNNLKLITATALVALCATSAAAHYVYSADMVSCQAVESDVQRLSCYDNMDLSGTDETPAPEAPPLAEVEPEILAPNATRWVFTQQDDPITGRETSFVYTDRTRAVQNAGDAPLSLIIRCDGEGGSQIYILSDGYIGGRRDRVPMEYRWNEDAAISESWNDSTNGKAAFLPRGYRDFLSGLAEGGSLVVRWSDYRGSQSASVWDNIVLSEQADYVLNGCQQ